MLAKSFSFLFYLKKRANQTPEQLPVYLRIYIEGQRSEIFTGRRCEPEKWNRKAERMIGLKEEVRLFNAYLDTIQSKIYEVHRVAAEKGDTIPPRPDQVHPQR